MAIQHQDNFSTNPTSAISAGATTSPLDDIPSVAAPFYLAFDATGANGHYEVVYVTSKTATNVNHAALTYAHSTDEIVRMIVPAREMDSLYQAQRGFLINGKIVPTDASGITLTVKTLAGADPSVTDPVHIRIGDTNRTITSALTVSLADGTNWMNLGGAELATKEVDLFAYAVWDSNSSAVALTFSRIPYANLVSDFSNTTTNEKYCAGYSGFTATDEVECIGRFAATLSAGAGYTWSVPTYTAANLIQKPIYETRWLSWTPTYSGSGSMTWSSVVTTIANYKIEGNICKLSLQAVGTTGGTASNALVASLPMSFYSNASLEVVGAGTQDGGSAIVGGAFFSGTVSQTNVQTRKIDSSNYGLGASRGAYYSAIPYRIV